MKARLEDIMDLKELPVSILGQVHYDLALYNYLGRFTNSEPDMESSRYHLIQATRCSSAKASKVVAYKVLGKLIDDFEDLDFEAEALDSDQIMDLLMVAATGGDQECMLAVAKAFQTGDNLGSRSQSWSEAVKWYEASLTASHASDGTPHYNIYEQMAIMYRQGGFDLERDASYAGELYSNAAEAAISTGKGKVANKFFMLSEEAYGEVDEDMD